MFENRLKSRIQHCERSELRLHFGQKFIENARNGQFGEEDCGQTVLPDIPNICGKCQKSNETICVIFKHCAYVQSFFSEI